MENTSKNKEIDDKRDEEQRKLIDFIQDSLYLWKQRETKKYDINKIHDIITRVTEIFKSEPTLVPMPPPCIIIGDYNGIFYDLRNTLVKQLKRTFGNKTSWNRFVFLGTSSCFSNKYIDCLCLLFTLKIMYPNQYILLRGRTDIKDRFTMKDFKENLVKKLGEKDGTELWEHFNEAFSWMPLACIIGGKILCVHSGISPDLKSLDDIRAIKRPLVDVKINWLAHDLLFKRPTRDRTLKFEKNGFDKVWHFNHKATEDCAARLGVELIVRAHDADITKKDSCIDFFANRSLVSVHSFPMMKVGNIFLGAALHVKLNGLIGVRWLAKFSRMRKAERSEFIFACETPEIDIISLF